MKQDGLVVVGAAGSLGAAFLRAIGNQSALQFLFDKEADPKLGIRPCDLASRIEIELALEAIPLHTCDMWRVLMTAGVYCGGNASKPSSWSETRESLEINLVGVVQFVAGFVERVRHKSKRARIGVVSSAAALVGSHDLGYGVAKAGLFGLVRSVSKQHARHGITIIGINPGLFDSAMSVRQSRERREAAIGSAHLARAIDVEEVVSCTRYAVFDAPDALTGTFLSPNGGQVAV